MERAGLGFLSSVLSDALEQRYIVVSRPLRGEEMRRRVIPSRTLAKPSRVSFPSSLCHSWTSSASVSWLCHKGPLLQMPLPSTSQMPPFIRGSPPLGQEDFSAPRAPAASESHYATDSGQGSPGARALSCHPPSAPSALLSKILTEGRDCVFFLFVFTAVPGRIERWKTA